MERPSGGPRAPQQTVRHGPLSFRPWVRVTGATLRFMASREQSFSSGCSGRWGSEGRAGRRPWDEEAEAGSTARPRAPGPVCGASSASCGDRGLSWGRRRHQNLGRWKNQTSRRSACSLRFLRIIFEIRFSVGCFMLGVLESDFSTELKALCQLSGQSIKFLLLS